MGISFRLAGCVWCESCAGAQSLNVKAANNMWRKLCSSTCDLCCIRSCACALKHTHKHTCTRTHADTLALHSLRCQSLPRGSSPSTVALKSRRGGGRRRVEGDPAWTPTICFCGDGPSLAWFHLLSSFWVFFSCIVGEWLSDTEH